MINEVILEGIVVRDPWKYMDDLFFRIVIYRDSDQPAKKLDQQRDAGDYVNIRLRGGANGLIQVRKGMRLRIHGFLQSRDYRESLEEFVAKAKRNRTFSGLEVALPEKTFKPNQVQIDRNMVEVVSKRIIVLDVGTNKTNHRKETGSVVTVGKLEKEMQTTETEIDAWEPEGFQDE
jgi:primosomal replication protein N